MSASDVESDESQSGRLGIYGLDGFAHVESLQSAGQAMSADVYSLVLDLLRLDFADRQQVFEWRHRNSDYLGGSLSTLYLIFSANKIQFL